MIAIRRPNLDLLRIHAEDAGFVMTQRALALEAPNYRLIDIYDLEQRLHGHLDALVLAGGAGEDVLLALADEDESAETAGTLLHVALRTGSRPLVEMAFAGLDAAADKDDYLVHLGRGAGWCAPAALSKVIRTWVASNEPVLRHVALDVCGQHRVDARDHLDRCLGDPDDHVRQRAAKLAGETGRVEVLSRVLDLGGVEAAIAGALLGGDCADRLIDVVRTAARPRDARRAAELFPIMLDPAAAKNAIRDLLNDGLARRWGLVAIGALGRSDALGWLVEAMAEPGDARAAVSAFEQVTGLYLAHADLELEEFPDDPGNPVIDDDPVEGLIDANTPWPDPVKVAEWLGQNRSKYPADERLLLGVAAWTFTGEPEPWVKYQSRYRAVALSQAMAAPGNRCPNWHSPVTLTSGAFGRRW